MSISVCVIFLIQDFDIIIIYFPILKFLPIDIFSKLEHEIEFSSFSNRIDVGRGTFTENITKAIPPE